MFNPVMNTSEGRLLRYPNRAKRKILTPTLILHIPNMFPAYLYLIQSSRMKATRSVQRKINDVAATTSLKGSNPARSEPGSNAVDRLAVPSPFPVHEPRADR